jgi:hypothetical protein
MSGRLVSLLAAAALLASVGVANAKDPVRLTNGQLDKVSAGAANLQFATNKAAFANGSNGPGGVNQFSPSTATVTQANTVTGLNLFTVH